MRSTLATALAVSLLAGACSAKQAPYREAADAAASAPEEARAVDAASTPGQGGAPASVPMLAYSYAYVLELPAARIAAAQAAHERACAQAGPERCQVVGSSSGDDRGMVTAQLRLRAAPAWLSRFRTGLDADARKAGGKVAESSVDSEDLTRAIVDTEAALRARTTLRDRLQALLAERPGKLSELLELERELARVQGELDATQSELAVMRARVQTSALTLDYRSEGRPVTAQAGEPLERAFNDFFRVMMGTVAALVYVAAVALPLALVAWPALWLIGRWRRRRRAAKAAPPTGDDA